MFLLPSTFLRLRTQRTSFRQARHIVLTVVLLVLCTSDAGPPAPAGQVMLMPQLLAAAGEPVRAHRVPLPDVSQESVSAMLLREADIPEQNWQSGHRGVDLAATPGQTVIASRGGIVSFAGDVAGTPVVSIQHSDGLRTTYEPVHSSVKRGQRVRRGEPIGRLADASTLPETARRSPGLSWGAKWGSSNSYVDPLSLLGEPRARLVPLRPER